MIRIGVFGYGNLGRGVEKAVALCPDMELTAIFSRRPASIRPDSGARVFDASKAADYAGAIDVMILCGGSATDLPVQAPDLARLFNTVDSFDTHAKIPGHFAAVDKSAKAASKLALISCGWDPGLFSTARCMFSSILPGGSDYTFWGKGVSQGHSDAIRRISGVVDARQYTIPVKSAADAARSGANPALTARQKHIRQCYVVIEDGADSEAIRAQIVNMPNYFSDYDTTVHFITHEELQRDHSGLPHGGFVICSGKTAGGNVQAMELSLKLDSNPEFTASVLSAYARAVYRMAKNGMTGAITVLDVPPGMLHIDDPGELRKNLL